MCDLDLYELRGCYTLQYHTRLQPRASSGRFFPRLKTSGGGDGSRYPEQTTFPRECQFLRPPPSIGERRLLKRLDIRHHFSLKNVHTRHCACVSRARQPSLPKATFIPVLSVSVVMQYVFRHVVDREKCNRSTNGLTSFIVCLTAAF